MQGGDDTQAGFLGVTRLLKLKEEERVKKYNIGETE